VPIDIASYRKWEGRAKATPLAALAIASTMVRRRMRLRLVKWIVGAFTLLPSGFAMLAFYFSLEGEGPVSGSQLARLGLADVNMLGILNLVFDQAVGSFAILFAALVAAPLIAEDRRAHALPLYFSRPIGHIEYVVGKAASAAFFLALLLVLPRICMYLVEVGFSETDGTAMRQMPTLLGSCATGAIGVVLVTSIGLGVSSLTERPTYAALTLLGVGAIMAGLAFHLAEGLDKPSLLALSPYACVQRIGMEFIDVPAALRSELNFLSGMPIRAAWTGAGIWTALSLGVLILRVRRVEVVT
jgi:ABC-type transport system involved in multi-copper enzyme maturation permease subunit